LKIIIPKQCIICNHQLDHENAVLHMGFYSYEPEINPDGKKHAIIIACTLHHYYSQICSCGHKNVKYPGSGYESVIEGRACNIRLSEHTVVGPMLAAFIAALNRDYGMSRNKIREYLKTWLRFELSTGTICKTIREAGIACYPVVDELIEQLQEEKQVHIDETTWKEKGILFWVWVGITANIPVYLIGSRKKEMLLKLITEAYVGWIITDGYGVYRSYEKRQRCLAHLIGKAVALTGAVDEQAQKMGDWFLRELRGLIKEMAQGQAGKKQCNPILARLKRACNLGAKSEHAKLKSLAKEILNDWDGVVAFVKNPELPATNNLAERALRWVVLYRKITFGTRTSEGSKSFAASLSVIKTCRLRKVDPWDYIAQTIARARTGLAPLTIG
jgi:transposase